MKGRTRIKQDMAGARKVRFRKSGTVGKQNGTAATETLQGPGSGERSRKQFVPTQAPPPISKFRDDARTDPPQGQGLPYYQLGEGEPTVALMAPASFQNPVILS